MLLVTSGQLGSERFAHCRVFIGVMAPGCSYRLRREFEESGDFIANTFRIHIEFVGPDYDKGLQGVILQPPL
mgnify:CR=1 FL=1